VLKVQGFKNRYNTKGTTMPLSAVERAGHPERPGHNATLLGLSWPRPFSSTLNRKQIAMDVASRINIKQHTDSAPEFLTYNPQKEEGMPKILRESLDSEFK
jgi:hypothetical protein